MKKMMTGEKMSLIERRKRSEVIDLLGSVSLELLQYYPSYPSPQNHTCTVHFNWKRVIFYYNSCKKKEYFVFFNTRTLPTHTII